MSGIEPILIGAAVGAGTSAIMGGNPLKGAALGGVTGGLGGAGGLFGGAKAGAANSAAASGINVVPQVSAAAAGPAAGTTTFFGGPAAAFSAPTYFNPSYTSLGGLINPTDISAIKDYMPSGQAIGSLGLQAAMTPRPQVTAPAGGITPGRAPDMSAVQGLIGTMRRKGQQIPADYFG